MKKLRPFEVAKTAQIQRSLSRFIIDHTDQSGRIAPFDSAVILEGSGELLVDRLRAVRYGYTGEDVPTPLSSVYKFILDTTISSQIDARTARARALAGTFNGAVLLDTESEVFRTRRSWAYRLEKPNPELDYAFPGVSYSHGDEVETLLPMDGEIVQRLSMVGRIFEGRHRFGLHGFEDSELALDEMRVGEALTRLTMAASLEAAYQQ